MMDENASQVKYSHHRLGEEFPLHLKPTFRQFIFTKTFLFQVIVKAIFSFHGFIIYRLKRQGHLHQVMFCEFSYIF